MAKKQRIEPLNGGILIEREPNEERTPGGIILPPSSQEKLAQGTVIACYAADIDDEECPVKPGDVVMFGKYDGTDLDVDGRQCVLLKKGDLTARIHD